MPRVALVAMERRNPRPEAEDALLLDALADAGVDAERVAWTRPVDWSAFDLAVLRTPWDYTERLDDFLAWVDRAAAATRLWNPPAVVRWNAHKSYLLDLAARGVPTVPTRLVRRGHPVDVQALAREAGWGEVVVKGAVDAGAARAWRGPADAARTFLEGRLADRDALVQPFLPEVGSEGETSLVFVDGVFNHAVRKRAAPGEWRVQAQWGGTAAPVEPSADERRVAAHALAAVGGPTLYARVDLVAGRVMELELIEPYLFLDTASAATLAAAIRRHLA